MMYYVCILNFPICVYVREKNTSSIQLQPLLAELESDGLSNRFKARGLALRVPLPFLDHLGLSKAVVYNSWLVALLITII